MEYNREHCNHFARCSSFSVVWVLVWHMERLVPLLVALLLDVNKSVHACL
jgi:hypothetical protein